MPASHWIRRPGLLLLAIIGIAAVLRIGIIVASGGAWYATDSYHYFRLAGDILAGNPTSERSNGYPLFIAALARALPGTWIPLVLLGFNFVASVTVVALAGMIGRNLAGWSVGLVAALSVAAYPNQLNYVRYLLTEAPTTLLLVAAVWILLRRPPLGSAVIAGVFIGLSVLMRSSLLAVGISLVVVLLVFRRPWGESVGLIAGAALIAILNVLLLVSGTIAPTRHTGPNLLIAIQSTSTEGVVYSTRAFSEEEQAAPLSTYLRFAAENPVPFAQQRLSALWELWGPWPASGDPENPRGLGPRLLIGLRSILLVLAAGGLVRHARDVRAWLLAAPILAITIVHVAFFATPRFTYVVEPLAAVLAAWWVVEVATQWRASRSSHTPPGAL